MYNEQRWRRERADYIRLAAGSSRGDSAIVDTRGRCTVVFSPPSQVSLPRWCGQRGLTVDRRVVHSFGSHLELLDGRGQDGHICFYRSTPHVYLTLRGTERLSCDLRSMRCCASTNLSTLSTLCISLKTKGNAWTQRCPAKWTRVHSEPSGPSYP